MSREVHVRFCEGLGVRFPRATRLVSCRGTADEAMPVMRSMMSRLKLTVHETKTSLRRLPAESFDFLGYTISRCYSPKTGRAYLGTRPSRKKIARLCREISEVTSRRHGLLDVALVVGRLNRKITGWANYFRLGAVSPAYAAVENHARKRLRQWLCRKHKVPGQGTSRYPDECLHDRLNLVRLRAKPRDLPWAKA